MPSKLNMAKARINTVEIYYEIHGIGEPILFIHGLGSCTEDWEHQRSFFAERYKVCLIDLRGHGKSEKPADGYTLGLFAQDVKIFISEILKEPVHLVGLSLGAMISCLVAADSPALVKSLTLVNCPARINLTSTKMKLQYFLRFSITKFLGMKATGVFLASKLFPQEGQTSIRELFVRRWRKNDKNAYLQSMKATTEWNIVGKIDHINCPVHVISAEHDYFPVDQKNEYVKKFKNADHKVIANTHHALPFEDPEAFNKALHDVLKA